MIESIIYLLVFIAGYALCYFTVKVKGSAKQQEETVMMKRVKPNLRNALRPTREEYTRFKTKDSNLYAPVKPKGEKKDGVEVGR